MHDPYKYRSGSMLMLSIACLAVLGIGIYVVKNAAEKKAEELNQRLWGGHAGSEAEHYDQDAEFEKMKAQMRPVETASDFDMTTPVTTYQTQTTNKDIDPITAGLVISGIFLAAYSGYLFMKRQKESQASTPALQNPTFQNSTHGQPDDKTPSLEEIRQEQEQRNHSDTRRIPGFNPNDFHHR